MERSVRVYGFSWITIIHYAPGAAIIKHSSLLMHRRSQKCLGGTFHRLGTDHYQMPLCAAFSMIERVESMASLSCTSRCFGWCFCSGLHTRWLPRHLCSAPWAAHSQLCAHTSYQRKSARKVAQRVNHRRFQTRLTRCCGSEVMQRPIGHA